MIRRSAQRLVRFLWPQLELFVAPAPPPAPRPASAPSSAPPPPGAGQLAADRGRWRWTRPWLVSPHLKRARRELDLVRGHFPELDGITVTIGMTRRRTILGLASMGTEPALWIRPRIIHRLVIAHEFVHLLQARGLVPGGEKAADLFALARSPDVIDVAPFYLKVPHALHAPPTTGRVPGLAPGVATLLHEEACRAIAANRGKTARGAVRRFEQAIAGGASRAAAAAAASAAR